MKRAAIILLLLAAACAKTAQTTAADSGAQGRVAYGPICPVERLDSPCPDRPYQATLRITRDGKDVTTITTDANGAFRVALDPGDYTITPVLTTSPPTGKPVDVTVRAHEFVTVTVTIDSGIR